MRMANLKRKFKLFRHPECRSRDPHALDHETVNWCNYCKAPIAKLHSSTVVRLTLLLRGISLGTFFLNDVRFGQ